MGDVLGVVGILFLFVGYSICLELKILVNICLLFVMNGIVFCMFEFGFSGSFRGIVFDEVIYIIVDEVYECLIELDFLFIVLKNFCEVRKDFKVVLMLVIVDVEKILVFFGGCFFMFVFGRMFFVIV